MSNPDSERCGYCGHATGEHRNCADAFSNGSADEARSEGYRLNPQTIELLDELMAIRAARGQL